MCVQQTKLKEHEKYITITYDKLLATCISNYLEESCA